MQYKNKSKIPRNITNPTITAGKASKNREILLKEVSNCQKKYYSKKYYHGKRLEILVGSRITTIN